MNNVFRCDKLPLGTIKKTDEGFIIADAPIAKVGVMSYILKDGSIRRELVDEETLKSDSSNETLKFKPVTNTHPQEKIVTKNNSKYRTVGSVGETVQYKNDALFAKFSINNQDAIDAVERGRKQLSPGYTVDLLIESGVYNGERYDAIQRNRRYNHLALVDYARGGSELALNIDHCDSEDGIQLDDESNVINNKNEESKSMETYKIDGIGYDTPPQVVNHISKLDAKIDELNEELRVSTENASKAEAKADSLSEEIENLKKFDSQEIIAKAVKERIELEKTASKIVKSDNFDGLTNVELMKKVIIEKYPDSEPKLDGKDDIYIEARFDAIVEIADKEVFVKQSKKVNNREDSKETKVDADASRKKMIEDRRNAYKKNKGAA